MLNGTDIKTDKLHLGNDRFLDFSRPNIMGVLNITPDSFSDGGRYLDPDRALFKVRDMIDNGADIIDIGGESSRPGSDPVELKTEIQRVVPMIRDIRSFSQIPISVDTMKAEVARQALDAGADIINDISALRHDPKMIDLICDRNVPIVLMHMLGTPKTMQQSPSYRDCVHEIMQFFSERLHFCLNYGVSKERIIIDPGIGFGKRLVDNLVIFKHLGQFKTFGCPIMVGASRKSFIKTITGSDALPEDRIGGSLAAAIVGIQNGADIIRVHDVAETSEALKVYLSIKEAN